MRLAGRHVTAAGEGMTLPLEAAAALPRQGSVAQLAQAENEAGAVALWREAVRGRRRRQEGRQHQW